MDLAVLIVSTAGLYNSHMKIHCCFKLYQDTVPIANAAFKSECMIIIQYTCFESYAQNRPHYKVIS